MKITALYKSEAKTGKGKFLNRLIPELKKLGCYVTNNPKEKTHIALHLGKILYKSNSMKDILRLGPAHVNSSQKFKKLNDVKWASMKKADAIVYQSGYSRNICKKFIGKICTESRIIFNGADPEYYKNVIPYPTDKEINFIASTRKWIKQKRLKYIIKAFKIANIPNSKLWIVGNTLGYKKKAGGVKYLGECDDEKIARLLKMATAMIHITYLDAAPNSVVEAICSGCPVICTDQGGTREYTSKFLIKDKKYRYKPIDLESPPKPDVEAIAKAMRKIKREDAIDPSHVDIKNVALKYYKFFKDVLR